MLSFRNFRLFALTSLVLLSATACATAPEDPQQKAAFDATNDPLEPMNRGIFSANLFLDHLLWGPLSGLYKAVVPPFFVDHIHDVLANMNEPINFMNNTLQGQPTRAVTTAGRFLINTTVGGAGAFDVATDWGLPEQHGDFGQTLWSWGLDSGPYLVLPLMGPNNPRDTVGLIVDAVADPWSYLVPTTGGQQLEFDVLRFAVEGIDKRAEVGDALDSLEKSSVDFYAQLRSVSRQYRNTELHGGDTSDEDQLKDIYRDDIYGNADKPSTTDAKRTAVATDTREDRQQGMGSPDLGQTDAAETADDGQTAEEPGQDSQQDAQMASISDTGPDEYSPAIDSRESIAQ